jgi:uncharacterized protein
MLKTVVQLAQQGVARAQEPGFAIRTARRSDEAAVMSFLRRDAPTNLFVLAWIARHGVVRNGGGITFSFYVAQAPRSSRIVGICLLVSQRMAMPVGVRAASKAFGERLRRLSVDLDHVVGEHEAVRGLWATYGWGRTPRLDRPQRFMVLDSGLQLSSSRSPVRRARSTDLENLIPLARAMYREEALVDPCRGEPGTFRRIQETRIRRGQVFVWRHGKELIFKTDISSFDPKFGAQLAGVYTVPARRGEGIATRALRDVCGELLQHVPRITLYVNEDNDGARRVYQRLGFRDHAGWLSIFIN